MSLIIRPKTGIKTFFTDACSINQLPATPATMMSTELRRIQLKAVAQHRNIFRTKSIHESEFPQWRRPEVRDAMWEIGRYIHEGLACRDGVFRGALALSSIEMMGKSVIDKIHADLVRKYPSTAAPVVDVATTAPVVDVVPMALSGRERIQLQAVAIHQDIAKALFVRGEDFPLWHRPEVRDAMWEIGRYFSDDATCLHGDHVCLVLGSIGYLTKDSVDNIHAKLVYKHRKRLNVYPAEPMSPATAAPTQATAAAASESSAAGTAPETLHGPSDVKSAPPCTGAPIAAETPPEASSSSLSGAAAGDCRSAAEAVDIGDMMKMITALFKHHPGAGAGGVLNIKGAFFSSTDVWRQPWFWRALYDARIYLHYRICDGVVGGCFVQVRTTGDKPAVSTVEVTLSALALCDLLKSPTAAAAINDEIGTISTGDAQSLVKALFENMSPGRLYLEIHPDFLSETHMWMEPWFISAAYSARVYLRHDLTQPKVIERLCFDRFKETPHCNITLEMVQILTRVARLYIDLAPQA